MAERFDVTALLGDPETRVVVCCGAGGVGKTTTSAALGVLAAEAGRNVVVMTIDPARRLAQSLGVDELTNEPHRVPLPPREGGDPVPGTMHAMMLDMRRTFDEMVERQAGPENARVILENPFYQAVATSFSGTQEYMAMEKLGLLVAEGEWDLVIVDTPPSRNALDFLDAPKRLGSFLDSRLMRLLGTPGRGLGRMATGAMALAMRTISKILGSTMLKDASEFVRSLDTLFGDFQERADRTYELLTRPSTRFVVVAAPLADALREAAFFVDRLRAEGMPGAALLLNRTHPRLVDLSGADAEAALERLDDVDAADRPWTAGVLRVHALRAATAAAEVEQLTRFTSAHPDTPVAGIPSLPFDVHSLEALRAVGDQMAGRG